MEHPRYPPGFDPRADLLLDFGIDKQGRDTLALAGVLQSPAKVIPRPAETGKLLGRLDQDQATSLSKWLCAADSTARLVLLHRAGSAAAWWPWEQLLQVQRGRVALVRCLEDAKPLDPVGPGKELSTLVVIGDPRQPAHLAGAALDVAALLQGMERALAAHPVGKLHVAAHPRWVSATKSEFHSFEHPDRLLEILRTGWDVVHCIAHAGTPAQDEHPMYEAGTLRLEDEPAGLGIEDLASALANGRTQLLILQACHGRPRTAEVLLRVVPELLVFRDEVPVDFSCSFGAALHQALFVQRLAPPLAVANARQKSDQRHSWLPAHFAVDLGRPIVHDEQDHARERYLAKVAEHFHLHRGLDLFGVVPELEELYVDLHLEAPREPSLAARELLPDELRLKRPGPYTLRYLLEELSAADGVSGKWVVVGDPGSGKTTSLRELALTYARNRRFVPIFVRLAEWKRIPGENGRSPSLAPFDSHIAEAVKHLGPPSGRPRLVLVDGLDECDAEDEEVASFLTGIDAERVVVATRRLHFRKRIPLSFRRVDLRDLTGPKQRALLAKLFGLHARRFSETWQGRSPEEEAKRRIDELTGSLQRAAASPFFLSLLAMLWAQGEKLTQRSSRFAILQRALDLLILAEHRHGKERSELRYFHEHPATKKDREALAKEYAATAREHLQVLAFRSTLEGKGTFGQDDLVDWLSEPGPGKSGESRADFLQTFVIPDSGLLRHVPGADALGQPCDRWEFAHRVLREALTAEHLGRRYQQGQIEGLQEFAEAVLSSDRAELVNEWGEPLALVTSYLSGEEQVRWVEFLRERHAGLGLRVLANAELEPALKARILSGAGDRGGRWRSFKSLLSTEDPSDTLALMDCLLASTASLEVADLARLDDLLRELEERKELAGAIRQRIDQQREALLDQVDRDLPDEATLRRLFLELPPGAAPDDADRGLWSAEIPPGSFEMGSPEEDEERFEDEAPVIAQVAHSFQMARVTVTRAQYRVMDPSKYGEGHDEVPATLVTWYEASFFARFASRVLARLNGAKDMEIRLPTEVEWEYACREAGAKATQRDAEGRVIAWWRYHSGNEPQDLERVANFDSQRLEPVGSREPNALGLFDMHGNVSEWCSSRYEDELGQANTGGPGNAARVLRGGAFWNDARYCRAAIRVAWLPAIANFDYGFRVVLAPRPRRR